MSKTDISRQADDALHTVLERTTDAIAVHRAGRIVYANPAALKLFGYAAASEVLGRSLFDFVSQGYRALVADRIFQTYAMQALAPELEERLLHASGETIPVEVIGIPLMYQGQPATLAHIRDIRAKKELELRIRTTDRLVSVGMVAAGIAHEIATPLTYAMVNLELLEARVPEDARGLLAAVKLGVDRASQVARSVRVLGARPNVPAPVDVHVVLDSCANLALLELRGRARLRKEYAQLPLVVANEQHLGQIFLNLIVNAAHAVPPGHEDENTVTLRTSAEKGSVQVEISDTGGGIPDDLKLKIFDPLFSTKSQGTGLGLPITQALVAVEHGTLSFESTIGKGTTFRVTLPANVTAAAPARPPSRARTKDKRILVVDDDVQLARALSLALSAHETSIATSGGDALEKILRGEPFDVILCDLAIADMDGIDLYERVKRERPDLEPRMLFMTGGAFSERAVTFLRSIPNRFLEKPFTTDELLDAVDAA